MFNSNKFYKAEYKENTFAAFDIKWFHIEKHIKYQIIYKVDNNLSKFEVYLRMLSKDNYITNKFYYGYNIRQGKNLHIYNH